MPSAKHFLSAIIACCLLLVSAATTVRADPPQIVFSVASQTNGPFLSGRQSISGNWSYSTPSLGSGIGSYQSTGTLAGSGDSLTVVNQCTIFRDWFENTSGSISGKDNVEVTISGGKTARIRVDASATASVNVTSTGNPRGSASWNANNSAIGINNSVSLQTNTNDTDSDSVSGHIYVSNGNCTGAPRIVNLGDVQAGCSIENQFEGTVQASGQIEYTVEILAGDVPVAQMTGPLVSGVPTSNPNLGATITFNNTSYDPDDGSSYPAGLCSALWTLKAPDDVVTTGNSLSTFSHTVNKPGEYTLELKVTDNEGQQATTMISFGVGAPRSCNPTAEEVDLACDKIKVKASPFCGNASFILEDPVPTRGYPLKNDIRIATRAISAPASRYMGNGFFTYGIEVALIGSSNPQRMLIDGAGFEYNYGLQSSGPSPKTAGVYPTLTQSSGGFVLDDAGAPDEIFRSGNFTYEFDTAGRLLKISDPNGNEQLLSYDSSDRPELVTDSSSGKTLEFHYGSNGKIDKVTENGGAAYQEIGYNGNDLITGITTKNAAHSTIRSLALTYDGADRVSTVTRDGNSATTVTVSHKNDGHGKTLANLSYATGQTNFNYFAVPSGAGVAYRTTIPNAKSGAVTLDFDQNGNLIKVTEPTHNGGSAAVVHTYTYDSNRNVLTSSNGATTITNTYNSLGLLTHAQDNAGRYTSYAYSGVNLTGISDNVGTLATFGYTDSALPNSITQFTDGAGNAWTFDRNSFGQIAEITPPSGSPTGPMTFTYEENSSSPEYGWLKSIENGAGDTVEIDSYTSLGDPTSITTSPSSGVTRTVQYAYDATQRVTTMTHGDGKTVEIDYTGGNATSVTDEAGTLRQYSYCADCGKLTGASGPMSWALAWVLDSDKDVTSFQDALTHSTTYEYGAARELKKITYPDTKNETFSYDNYGRLWLRNNSEGQSRSLTFDASGWVTKENASDEVINYTYNNDGTVQEEKYNPVSNAWKKYEYTASRRIKKEQYNYMPMGAADWHTFDYTYNADGTLATKSWSRGATSVATWTYGYDAAGRMNQVSNSFGETTTFSYDGEGRVLTQGNSNGTSVLYEYNSQRGWPTKITHKAGATVTQEYTLEYDGGLNTVGNLTKVTELSGSIVTYTYDSLYRLLSETRTGTNAYTKTYTYDLAGNVLTKDGSTFGVYDNANKMTAVLGQTVTHDNAGEITAVGGSVLTLKNFQWTRRGKLKLASASGSVWREFKYQGDGTIISGGGTVGGGTLFRLYSLGDLQGEAPGSPPTAAYTYGPTGLISKRNLTGTPASFWYQYGPQGEARALTNSAGTVTDTYRYTAYGELLGSTGSTVNPFRYGGKFGYYTDVYSGLIIAGQRWYSPQLLRWLTRDPIHYEGGVNLYEYVGGDPVNWIDTTGLSPDALVVGEGFVDLFGPLRLLYSTPQGRIGLGLGLAGYCIYDSDGCRAVVDGFCDSVGFTGPFQPNFYSAEHTKGKRPSTEEKHQQGEARKGRDRHGGEKGDVKRYTGRKRPINHKGPWPPRDG